MGNRTTHLDVLVEVLHRAELDLHALDALALHLRRRLYGVHDRVFDDGQQHASANDGVRAERHKHVREAIDAHGQVGRRVRLPLRVQVDAIPPNDLEGKLPRRVIPYVGPHPGLANEPGRHRRRRTSGAEDNVEILGLAVFRLDPGCCEFLDRTRDVIDLGNITG